MDIKASHKKVSKTVNYCTYCGKQLDEDVTYCPNCGQQPDKAVTAEDIRCPECGSEMILRTAKQGPNAGGRFYVCTRYPECKGKVPIRAEKDPDGFLLEQTENTSGQGKLAKIPPEIPAWNWGAFFLSWIWGVGNSVWIALLCLIPFVNWVMIFVLGAKGNEWAWQNRKWDSIEHFKRNQRTWAWVGLGVGLFYFAFFIIYILIIIIAAISESN